MISETIKEHKKFLREKIFQIDTKWPHFQQLIDDLEMISATCSEKTNIAILERSYIYGGDSLFAPLFTKGNVITVDCQTLTANERGAYQKDWTNDERCIHIKSDLIAPITSCTLETNSVDILIIPNVVHHVRDQDAMFKEFSRVLKPGGRGYIFEALLRELHQSPDDYVRYTPWGFEYMLEKTDLKLDEFKPIGGPFEAISYCWIQALEYLPEEEREEKEKWFYDSYLKELLEMDKKHPINLKRKFTSFPLGYGIFFSK